MASVVNVAHIFGPKGAQGQFDKIMPTPGERETWNIKRRPPASRSSTSARRRSGLLICYDIEFPLLSRALAEAGADIILAPSNTELEHGYWRVRIGAMARALENQVYTVHAPVVGASAVLRGVARQCRRRRDLRAVRQGLSAGRRGGAGRDERRTMGPCHGGPRPHRSRCGHRARVQTFRHWPEQPGAGPLPKAEVIDLTGEV